MADRAWLRPTAIAIVAVLAGLHCEPASSAGWRLRTISRVPALYNQGIAFDGAFGSFVFGGVTGLRNSGLFRTSSTLRPLAGRAAALPATRERYNHVGDLTLDPMGRRLLLPLECYDPYSGVNTCGSAAIGVADPRSLAFRYYVNLDRSQIKKAMWTEVSADGRWIFTSSGRRLLAYRAADVNRGTADRQRAGTGAGIAAKDLGAVLPPGGVTGGAVSGGPTGTVQRLLVAVNRGNYFQIVSYLVVAAPDGSPAVATPRPEISVTRSALNNESEGLAATGALRGAFPLGGALHWQMLAHRGFSARILSYLPA